MGSNIIMFGQTNNFETQWNEFRIRKNRIMNVQYGTTNLEVKFIIRYSLFDILKSKLFPCECLNRTGLSGKV